jgi:biotin operon repressor
MALLAETEIIRAQALTRSTRSEVLATVDRLRRVGTDVKAVRS